MAHIEVSLDEFDTDEIVEYLEDNGFKVFEEGDDERDAELMRVWAAMRLGQNEQALELMQLYVCDKLGRVL